MAKANVPAVPGGEMSATLSHALAGGEIEESDNKQIAAQIAQRVLQAETLDDVFAAGGTVAAVELIGTQLELFDVAIRRSNIEGTTAYVLVDAARLDTGERIIVNTSAPRVMSQLVRAHDLGGFGGGKSLKVEVIAVGNPPGPGQSPPIGLRLVK